MTDGTKIAVFEDGELKLFGKGGAKGEAVLALPLDRFISKVVEIPADSELSESEIASQTLQPLSPYPDTPLTVSCETLRESPSGRIVLAVAVPEDSADDIADALDVNKLNVTRIDVLSLGTIRMAWQYLGFGSDALRRLVLVSGNTSISLFVMDGECPVAVRAIPKDGDLKREVMLSLIEAEAFADAAPLVETVVLGECDASQIEDLASIRVVDTAQIDSVEGIAQRSAEENTLNALPDAWREVLDETRFKAKMKRYIAAAMALWLVMLGVIVGVPQYYDYLTGTQREISKSHSREYRRVREKKEQVEAVRSVFNHDLGALESLRVVADAMPEGLVLSRWNFKRGDILTFSGTSESGNHQSVYDFKDALSAVKLSHISGDEGDDETPYFQNVILPRGVVSKGSKASFDVECDFKAAEEGSL